VCDSVDAISAAGVTRRLQEDGLDLEVSKRKVAALTAPRNVVLVGASDRPGSWAARVWRNLNRYQFPGPIHLINPRRDEIWEQPCYPDFKALPEPPDHLVVLVPAAAVAETLRSGGRAQRHGVLGRLRRSLRP
jgi:acetate---CoA ligase (ADP-forming)